MRAMIIETAGGPEVLAAADMPVPTIEQPTDVLVRLRAAGVNPVDTKMRANSAMFGFSGPVVLGCDGAGVVEKVGAQVRGFKPGDEVYFSYAPHPGRQGSYAEYTLVDQRLLAPKPRTLSFAQAAAIPLVLITAWESFHDRASLKVGDKVLIHAGAGGVGHVAIQIAKLAGASVATTVGSKQKAAFAESFGADRLIYYKEKDFAAETLAWTGGAGVDVALDSVGGKTFGQTFPAVRIYGDLVTLLLPPPDTNWTVARGRNLRVSFEVMLTPSMQRLDAARAHQGEILRRCAPLFDEGKLRIHVHETLPLARAADAHRLLASGEAIGKVVLSID